MILVPSLLPASRADAARGLRGLARSGTLTELRIDGMRHPRPGAILNGPRPPVIVTCRRQSEGGRFKGTAREATEILIEAVRHGADFIDVEHSLGAPNLRKLIGEAGRRRIILSYHNPDRTPADLAARFRAMRAMKPAFVKVAVTARSFADTARILEIHDGARKLGQKVSAIAMGEYGVYTRILQGPLGGALTFAALEPARPTAAGQLPFGEMERLYRVTRLNSRTKVFGLLGNPVRFSRGFVYHNRVFRRRKKNAVYVNFAADDAAEFMRIMGARISGLSVTMPFKGSIRRCLDRVDASSSLTGSVNTVLNRRGVLVGLNTDFHAFLSLLQGRCARMTGLRMLVFGTGNTAATAACAGVISGADVFIAGRSDRKARALAGRFGCRWMPASEQSSARAGIIVNATPVGMTGAEAGGATGGLVAPSSMRHCRLLCDFANPLSGETRLVAAARRRGCAVVTGAEIFSLQAAMQSRMFLALA